MLIHGVTFTAELNWGHVFAPLSRHFRVVAIDLRGHGDGISAGSRFRLEDCADDIAALAEVLGLRRFVAVGYSMGGMVAQLLYRRHPSLLSGLVLCATARNVLGSPVEKLAALALPATATAIRWNPFLQPMTAELLGLALMGPVDDPVAARQARAQLRRTSLGTAISAIQAVSEFTSHSWIGQGPHRPGQPPAAAGPGDSRRLGPRGGRRSRGVRHQAAAVHSGTARGLLVGGGGPRRSRAVRPDGHRALNRRPLGRPALNARRGPAYPPA
jgi:pimeloyl-ACP methyl ester carboxylesterase